MKTEILNCQDLEKFLAMMFFILVGDNVVKVRGCAIDFGEHDVHQPLEHAWRYLDAWLRAVDAKQLTVRVDRH